MKIPEELRKLADVFEKKNADYNDAYKKTGHVLSILDGYKRSPKEHNTIQLFGIMVGKMVRVQNLIKSESKQNFESIEDTLNDLSIYAQMLKETIMQKEN